MRKRLFGRDEAGRAVEEIVLESADAAVSVLSLGCIVRDWRIDGPAGSLPVVLGFPRLEDYLRHARSHGAIVGRVANRTAGAQFTLDGRTWELDANEGKNHLHGGTPGLGGRIWRMEADSASGTVELGYASPDGEAGYPGAVDFTVRFRLEGATLVCEMEGRPDRVTPISLANHSYYNLGGGGTVKDHLLWLDAPEYTVTDAGQIPTGEIRPVEGTRLDFTEEREIGDTPLDDNLVLRRDRDVAKPAARVFCPRTDARLGLVTAEPGVQVFDAATMTIGTPGNDGASYGPFAGLCLEAQHFPDSLHHEEFPGILHSPDDPYFQRLAVEIRRGA
jgi:aldose 1-epimerase